MRDSVIARLVRNAHDGLNASGGFTGGLETSAPESGYIVGGIVDSDIVRTCTYQTIERFIRTNLDLLDKGAYLGLWQSDKVYLDISEVYDNLDEASEIGRNRSEIAIWDIRNNREIVL